MQLIGVYPDYRTVYSMHLSNLLRELPAVALGFDDIEVEFVPFGCRGAFWTWEYGKGMEDEAVDDHGDARKMQLMSERIANTKRENIVSLNEIG